MSDKERVYKSNIQILYHDLKNAIKTYIEHGHTTGEIQYVNAYLMAVLAAIAAYNDTVENGREETDEIKACKYANNLLKHDPTIVTHIKPEGGITFPMSFPLTIPEIDVVWKWQELYARSRNQNDAFKNLFAGKPVLQTLDNVLLQLGIESV